jgi:hypothetical protein
LQRRKPRRIAKHTEAPLKKHGELKNKEVLQMWTDASNESHTKEINKGQDGKA